MNDMRQADDHESEQAKTKDRSPIPTRLYAVFASLLLPINLLLYYSTGSRQGMSSSYLLGYSIGFLIWTLLIVFIARLFKRCRTTDQSTRIVFWCFLIFCGLGLAKFDSPLSLFGTNKPPAAPPVASYDIDETAALALGEEICAQMRAGTVASLKDRFDGNRFRDRVLRFIGQARREDRQYALGAANSFRELEWLNTFSSMVRMQGSVVCLRLEKDQERRALLFRIVDQGGMPHYISMYLFSNPEGRLGIEDIRVFESGPPLAQQSGNMVVEQGGYEGLKSFGTHLSTIKRVGRLGAAGDTAAALQLLETLPPDAQQTRIVRRLKVQLCLISGHARGQELLRQFEQAYPKDKSIHFSRFYGEIVQGNCLQAATRIDAIETAVHGDPFLLWIKARLLFLAGQPQQVTRVLDKLAETYKVDVVAKAAEELSPEFLQSDAYQQWRAARKTSDRAVE